jgi:hypothetical protein
VCSEVLDVGGGRAGRAPSAYRKVKREDALEGGPTVTNQLNINRQGERRTGASRGRRTKRASHKRNIIYGQVKDRGTGSREASPYIERG